MASFFINVIEGLDLTAGEELDLLAKWLGKESSEYVKRFRSVHINNPKLALQMVWDRLNQCYAAPEIVESALFSKLDNFPRISNKDNSKLRELGDLLLELRSAKEDGYLPGLTYLDTARGINPIVDKLPHNLQEKWVSIGSRYKDEHYVSFPPFSFFTQFVCCEARIRNDPSFKLSTSNTSTPRYEKPSFRNTASKGFISAHKTDITTSLESQTDKKDKRGDLTKICPIHNKPHPLAKCRGFRAKPIEERRIYLKENNVCFRCCASMSHLARDCRTPLKCRECESERHSTAMHPGPTPWTSKPVEQERTEQESEKEEKLSDSAAIDSQCTEVCGMNQSARSCSKICLVKVYKKGQPEHAVSMYAILDDQSNRSLVRSEFFDLFDIQSSPHPYSLRTCAGVMEMIGRKAHGFQKASSGSVSIDLPPLIECNEILNNRLEIPTPEVALCHPHLKPIARFIPKLDLMPKSYFCWGEISSECTRSGSKSMVLTIPHSPKDLI